MTLTKDERFTAYCIMLAEAEFYNPYGWGFCGVARHRLGLEIYSSDNFRTTLPELFSKRQRPTNELWFDNNRKGWQKRIELLKTCINETHP